MLALGTRLGPFGTLPQYEMDYWPQDAKIIQVDADHKMLGLVKKISVGICGEAKAAAQSPLQRLDGKSLVCDKNKDKRAVEIKKQKGAWEKELDEWIHEKDDYSLEAIARAGEGFLHPRQVLRELEEGVA